ncbi:FtsL-like putative cell division protein [Plebeiibacterium marinum]|uniref:FtsL-like putative cell division protein n=1 Tax=Plebeiibacterium marinum TaxID=2992111 RepID=A0AAE3SIA2_9BACT|nr:FtsL-like putative cell division protein [Plebeiobacterium marinum]MCW3804248.1 FtsL-like putative cell division protein [Plebeiobacterium marinum]
MTRKKRDKEFVGSGDEAFKKITLRDFVSGRIFTKEVVVKQLPYFLFLIVLAFSYISNHFKVEKLLKEAATLNKEIQELRIEAITTSSDLMYISKQSVIREKVNAAGVELDELTEPPRRIVIKK